MIRRLESAFDRALEHPVVLAALVLIGYAVLAVLVIGYFGLGGRK